MLRKLDAGCRITAGLIFYRNKWGQSTEAVFLVFQFFKLNVKFIFHALRLQGLCISHTQPCCGPARVHAIIDIVLPVQTPPFLCILLCPIIIRMSAFDAVQRLERAFPQRLFPQHPNKPKCQNYLRWGQCNRSPQCHFDHPRLYRSEARIESDIKETLPELSLLVELSNAIRAACERALKDPKPAVAGVALQDLLAAALGGLFEQMGYLLPLSEDTMRGCALPPHVTHALQMYFYFDCLPRLHKAVRALPGLIYRPVQDGVDARVAECLARLQAQEDQTVASISQCLVSAVSPDGTASVAAAPAWLAALDRDISAHAAQQAALMGSKMVTLEAVRLALLAALQPPLARQGYSVELRAFGSIVSGLGSPKSDLDLSLVLTPIPVPGTVAAVAAAGADSGRGAGATRTGPAGIMDAPLDAVLNALGVARPLDDDDVNLDDDLQGLGDDDAEDDSMEWMEEEGREEWEEVVGVSGGEDGDASICLEGKDRKDRSGSHGSFSGQARPPRQVFTVREFVASARVPVLKLHHPATGTDIDVIHSNLNGLTNTQMLREYAGSDPRARPLMLAVKRWSSSRGVSNSSNSTLSSYAWVLLVIFFLQCRKPSVLPNLQSAGAYAYKADTDGSVYGVGGAEGGSEDGRESKANSKEAEGMVGVGRLLCEFFVFYGLQGGADDCLQVHNNVAAVRCALSLPKPHHRATLAKSIDRRRDAETARRSLHEGKGDGGVEALEMDLSALDLKNPLSPSSAAGDTDMAVVHSNLTTSATSLSPPPLLPNPNPNPNANPNPNPSPPLSPLPSHSPLARACSLALSSSVALNAPSGRFSIEGAAA